MNLKVLHNIRRDARAAASQEFVNIYISTSLASGTSVECLEEQLQELCKDGLISDEIYQRTHAELHPPPSTPNSATAIPVTVESVDSIFNKDTVYHAGICSLAVCTRDPGNYRQLFKDGDLVPGHSFTGVSLSQSKQNRYLIARQDDSTIYLGFQSEPLLLEWSRQYKSFSEGAMIPVLSSLIISYYVIMLLLLILQVLPSTVDSFPPASLWNCSTNGSALSSLVRELIIPKSSMNCVIMVWLLLVHCHVLTG